MLCSKERLFTGGHPVCEPFQLSSLCCAADTPEVDKDRIDMMIAQVEATQMT